MTAARYVTCLKAPQILNRAIDRFERDWKYDGSYMRDIIDASPRAAWLFSRAAALGQFRAARFLVGAARKGCLHFATINGLRGVIVDGPDGPAQTAAFEIEGDLLGRCTWCAIRTSCGIWVRPRRTRTVPGEPPTKILTSDDSS